MIPKLTDLEILQKLAANKGLIPTAIIADGTEILWQDLENFHFYEGFFHKSLNTFTALKGHNIDQYITDVSVLKNSGLIKDSIYPKAFIFHAGRCGSTTLAKVLARSRQNLVISESGPLNRILQALTLPGEIAPKSSSENLNMYRNLVLALGRKRIKTHQRYFIKFTSFNILFFDFIHAAFPDVPCIFLTRPIAEILSSWQKKSPGWLRTQAPWMMDALSESKGAELKEIVERFIGVAAEKDPSILKHIDYGNLTSEGLPQILDLLNVSSDESEMEQMLLQLRFDSKTEFNKKLFEK